MNIKKIALCIIATFPLTGCFSCNNIQKINWSNNQQMLLVISHDWNDDSGLLYRYEYFRKNWVAIGQPIPVSLGKKGIAIGNGLYPLTIPNAPYKKEGDMRSPAGIFKIGDSFGYANNVNFSYPYKALTTDDYCIDNSQSIYYNKIINRQSLNKDVHLYSTEPMRRDFYLNGDQLYKLGFLIQYNPMNIPKAGSCIFVHLRTESNATTAGCTAMDEDNMQKVLGWLDVDKTPLFILLPMNVYKRQRIIWNLPKLH